jgi:phosphatidylglycerol:prolipoprotein diacylglycerol transferase
VIWDNDPRLPWHVAFVLLEIAALTYVVTRLRSGAKTWMFAAGALVVFGAAHAYYALNLAEQYPYVGPHALPWHGIFILAELASLAFTVNYYARHKKITTDALFPAFVVVAAHAFYIVKLAGDHPTFELEVRWYGVVFAFGLLLGARSFPIYFERWGFPRKHGEELCLWTPIGMLLGAHFVHMIFYETDAIVNNPIRLLQLGSGLASHGGGLGAILGVVFFAWKKGLGPKTMLKYMDPGMCASTFVIPWVRVGNFFNSEIVGAPWDGPWAITFPRHDCGYLSQHYGPTTELCRADLAQRGQELVSRHPSQAYEAILAFIMVGIAIYLQRKWRNRLRPGAILFILLGYYFSTRFLVELLKDRQGVDDATFLSMGQMLSIPIVLVSLYMLFFSKTSNIRSTIAGPEVIDNPPLIELPPKAVLELKDAGWPQPEEASDAPAKRAPKRSLDDALEGSPADASEPKRAVTSSGATKKKKKKKG